MCLAMMNFLGNTMAKQDEQRLLVKIATLYYLEGRKQSDIAQLLSLSQSFISRAITRCQKEGVVKISVVQPSNIFLNLEKGIEEPLRVETSHRGGYGRRCQRSRP